MRLGRLAAAGRRFIVERWRGAAVLAVAAAATGTLAMCAAKVACILSAATGELGRSQVAAEAGPLASPGWFADDVIAGAIFGLLAGALCGLPRARWPRRAATAVAVLLGLALAGALLVCVQVYDLFGAPPSWQVLASFAHPQNAKDSVAAMLVPGRIALVVSLAMVLGAGTPLLRRALDPRPVLVRRLAVGLGVLLLLTTTAGRIADRSRFELDRNPFLAFARSALFPASDGSARAAGGWDEVLAPVAAARASDPPDRSYDRLREIGARAPNVLLVILESTAVRHMGLTGGPVDNTPTLTALAGDGIFWSRHYAHTPSSMFAIYQILCSNHGKPQGPHISRTRPRIDCRSLPEVLSAAGWRAGFFHSGRNSYYEKDLFLGGRGYEVIHDTQTMPHRESYRETSWGIEERATIDAMLGWVKQDRSRPFFLTYVPVYPHHPYPVPDEMYRRFKRPGAPGKYQDSIFYMDTMLGTLLTGLDAAEMGDTLVVVVGDHGEGFGEHPGSQLHGSKLYDETARTFVIWWGIGLPPGTTETRATGHTDIAPTLLDALGLPAEKAHTGRSLARAQPDRMLPLYTGYGYPLVGFIDGTLKAIVNRRNNRVELYDLAVDPDEKTSIAGQRPAEVRAYRERASRFVALQKEWQTSLPDLSDEAADFAGHDETWLARPTTCRWKEGDFADVNGALQLRRPAAEPTVFCEHDLPPRPGAITSLTMRGVETIPSSFITAMLIWHGPRGQRREVAYCTMNGNPRKAARECQARLVAGSNRIDGGGKLVLELRFASPMKQPPAVDAFSVSEVEVGYRLRE